MAIAAVAAVLAVVFVLFAARSSTNGSTAASPAAGGAAPAQAAGAFTARTLDGAGVDVPGSRPSALFFYSVECGACGPGAQSLAQVQKAVGAKANFVAVNVNPGDTAGDISGFLRDNHAEGLALIKDTDAHLLQAYQVNQLSTALILNASGQVVYRAVDPNAAQIQSELAKAGAR
ncbi:thioredoxin-like domain-containing protein [Dermatophilaceae bacterium Soc4.6]